MGRTKGCAVVKVPGTAPNMDLIHGVDLLNSSHVILFHRSVGQLGQALKGDNKSNRLYCQFPEHSVLLEEHRKRECIFKIVLKKIRALKMLTSQSHTKFLSKSDPPPG